jgi:hypothetical protein
LIAHKSQRRLLKLASTDEALLVELPSAVLPIIAIFTAALATV